MAGSGLFIGVHSSVQARTFPEFVALVKANPGKINMGNTGFPQADLEILRDRLGLDWVNVPYKGGLAANTALMAGEIRAYTPDVNQGLPGIKEGRVRLLAYTELQRHPALPDVPTIAESGVGLPDYVWYVWLGTYAPAAVPADIVTKLNAEVNEMAGGGDALTRITAMGWRPNALSVAEIRRRSIATNDQVAKLLAKGVKLR